MARKICQIKYNKQDDMRTAFKSGAAFKAYQPIVQLGIQTVPGTKFYLNSSSNPIIVGSTGIYEINLINNSPITWLAFDEASLKFIDANGSAYLLIDIIYDN